MLVKAPKTVKILKNYLFYLNSCDKMRSSENLSLKSLQRVLRLSCKTSLTKDRVLVFRLKGTKKLCNITLESTPNAFLDCYYFRVSTSYQKIESMQISCKTLKELMNKINYSYSLLKPTL